MTVNRKRIVIFLVLLVLAVSVALASGRTFYFEETDFVKLAVDAIDPDKDQVTLNFTEPLDEEGEWQTNYGDAGEYDVKIMASDGENVASEDVKLVINKKNQPPYLLQNKITVKENEEISLKVLVVDPEKDLLEFTFEEPFNEQGKWLPSYDDEGSYIINFVVNDGEAEVTLRTGIEVLHASQPPKIVDIFSLDEKMELSEDTKLEYYVEAEDDEDTILFYKWELDGQLISNEKGSEHYFNFDSAGTHLLRLIISDSIDSTTKEWNIEVENKNRKPEIEHLPVTVNEGEEINLFFPETDLDKDLLVYEFEEPFNENGKWLTNYEDEGEYSIRVTASDEELKVTTEVEITVNNVDQAPVLEAPTDIFVNEGDYMVWDIDAYDPDGDEFSIKIKKMPDGSTLNEEGAFVWEPEYDTLERRGGFFSNLINLFGIEHYFLDEKIIPIGIEACSNELCTVKDVNIHVYNVNQKPVFSEVAEIIVNETDEIKFDFEISDPDGDFVDVSFGWPLDESGEWETGYEDAGEYEVIIVATDGRESSSLVVPLTVLPTNREPSIEIDDDEITINEGQEFTLHLEAFDPDNDELDVIVKNLPEGAVIHDGVFVWEPVHNIVDGGSDTMWNRMVAKSSYFNKKLSKDKEVVWLEFAASDGISEVIHPVQVNVKNVNRAPYLVDFSPVEEITVRVNEPVIFRAVGGDYDGEALDYTWSFGFMEAKVKGTDTIERTFVTPGVKKVNVRISDRDYFVEKEWTVNVVNQVYVPKDDIDVALYFID